MELPDDPIEDSSADLSAPQPPLRGKIRSTEPPRHEIPPSHFILDDGSPTPLLVVRITEQGNSTRQLRLSLWGVWADRLADVIKRGVSIEVHGASYECADDDEEEEDAARSAAPRPLAAPGEPQLLAYLPPSGALAHAVLRAHGSNAAPCPLPSESDT